MQSYSFGAAWFHPNKESAINPTGIHLKTKTTLIIAAALLLNLASAAYAQKSSSDFVRTPIDDGHETAQYVSTGEYWPGGVVNWYYNPTNQPLFLNTADVLATMQIAAGRWAQMCNITFNYMGISYANRNFQENTVDRVSVVGWASFPISLWDASGVTYWNFSRSTQAIVDADIFLNTQERWNLHDVDAVMTHEIGHMIGLDHSNVKSSIMSATPYNTYEYQRTLRGDDVAACTKLYGASPNALINRTLNWAEANFATELKAGPVVTQGDGSGFFYRYYSGSNSIAGVKNGVAYYYGPDRVTQNMGALSDYTARVQAAGF